MNIYLVRHTRPDIPLSICYGRSDVGLSDDFKEVSGKIARYFECMDDFRLYASPLSRCLRLAEKIRHRPPLTDDRLMEMDMGAWEGVAWDAIERKEMDAWARDMVNFRTPGGESLQMLFDRSTACFSEITRQNGTDIVIVTHSGVIRCVLAHVLELPPGMIFRFHIDFGGISIISFDHGRFQISGVNITALQ